MREATKGVLAIVAACTIWGLSPLYYKLLAAVPPPEVLSHRTLWSLALFGGVLALQGRLGAVPRLLASRRDGAAVLFAALMISLNWFVFILSIQIGRAVEASLGYYLFPLVAVALGVLVFRERLSLVQAGAVALAAAAVLTLVLGLGATPWVSLILAVSFGLYGLAKKRSAAGPVVSVTAEVLVLAPVAVFWLAGVHALGWTGIPGRDGGAVFLHNMRDSLLLVLSGPITAGPLILFSYASKRITLASVGLIQYLNPTLQFACAVFVFGEPFTGWHAVAFSLIWLALAAYSADALARERRSRRVATNVPASSATIR